MPDISTRPFPTTGPHGHRKRMRERILARGPGTLADYEVLEMLLFLSIPLVDTKPLAKALINRFGSLEAVLAAPAAALAEQGGLAREAILPIRLVEAAAAHLARVEIRERPLLNTLDRVAAHIGAGRRDAATRVLYLDNRNRLLADEPADAHGLAPRPVLARALALHATALLIVDTDGAPPAQARAAAVQSLARAAALVSAVVHDRLALGADGLASYRAAGLLRAAG